MVPANRSLLTHLPELVDIQRAAQHAPRGFIELSSIAEVTYKNLTLPIIKLDIGSRGAEAPTFVLVAGVHGLERIGSRVVISYLRSLIQLARWDESVHSLLERCRFVVVPIVNPIGMYLGRRSNGNGVDLMRNAPVDSAEGGRLGIAAGHRISPLLPWFRGVQGAPMEIENQAICELVDSDLAKSRCVLVLDVHSGFGAVDRLWFPYAKTAEPYPDLSHVYGLTKLLDRTYPHHIYRVEPQAKSYTTHGDLWDYLYDRNRSNHPHRLLMPLTLELGSWLWIKKNPIQAFSALGIFNPLLPHRTQRILRRHATLLDFLLRAVASPKAWVPQGEVSAIESLKLAKQRWYEKRA